MDRKNFIDKIKTMFSEVKEVVSDIPTEEEFKDITTEEGVVLRTSEAGLVEGEKLEVVSTDEEGVETVAEATEGEYMVESKTISVGAEGVISSVVDTEVEEPKEEAVVEEEMSEALPKWAEALVSRLDSIELANSNIAESMSAIDELSKVVSTIANQPAEEEIKLSKKVSKKQEKANNREERLKFLSKR
tara:strand:+ start:137 stop:703 length:567 start_codon:yes stop_codon:yes gene_type:complete